MATIDELVTVIRFELEQLSEVAKAERRLMDLEESMEKVGKAGKKSEAGTKKAKSGVDKLGRSFGLFNKNAKATQSASDVLIAKFNKIALATAGALSVSKAWNFAMGSAESARRTQHFSDALDLNASELSLWESAIRSAGYSAEEFRSSLQGIQGEYGAITLDEVLDAADELKQIVDQNNGELGQAIHTGMAKGYSREIIPWLARGSEAILADLETQRKAGNERSKETIDNNKKLADSYNALSVSLERLGERLLGIASPELSKALDRISEYLSDNQSVIEEWTKKASNSISLFVESMTSELGNAGNEVSKFNGILSRDNARDPDPEVRKENYSELRKKAFWQATKINAGALRDTAGTIVSSVYDLGSNLYNGELSKAGDSITDTVDHLYGIGSKLSSDYSKITSPLKDAQRANLEVRYGSDILRKIERLTQKYEANPELREQAYERSRMEVVTHFDQRPTQPSSEFLFGKPQVYSTVEDARKAYESRTDVYSAPDAEPLKTGNPIIDDYEEKHGRFFDLDAPWNGMGDKDKSNDSGMDWFMQPTPKLEEFRRAFKEFSSYQPIMPPQGLNLQGTPGSINSLADAGERNITINLTINAPPGMDVEQLGRFTVGELHSASELSDYETETVF